MGDVAAGAMKVVGSVLSMEGHRQAGDAARVAGQRRNVAAQFEAEQLEQAAGQSIAASQRDAAEQKRQADLLASRALALAAASGGGTDGSVVKIISDLKGEGSYRSAVALYRGEENARRLRMAGKAKRFEGALAEEQGVQEQGGHEIAGMASLFTGGSSLYGRYGGGGPSSAGGGTLVSEMVPGQFSTGNPSYG